MNNEENNVTPEEKRKKKFAAEYKVKIVDEAKKVKKDETSREYVGKTKTGVDINPTLKTSAEKSVKEARIDEISSRTTGRYVTKATDDYLDASKRRDEPRRAKRLTGILRAHRLEKKRENVDEAVKTTNAGYGYHGTLDGKGADSGYAKAHAKIKEIVNGKPKTGKDKKGEEKAGVPDRVITHYLDSVHGRKLGDSGMLDDAEHVKNDFKKFRQNYNPGHFGEDVEPISELSKTTLRSYIKKAWPSARKLSATAQRFETIASKKDAAGDKTSGDRYDKSFRKYYEKAENRANHNMKLAQKKLNKRARVNASEEVEPIDELSNATMCSYVKKAAASNTSAAPDDEKTITKRNRGVNWALARAKKRFPEKFKEEAEMEYTVEEFLDYLGELTEEQAFDEIEQLDELSKKTLSSYVRKAENEKYDYDPNSHKARKRDESIGLALAKVEMKKSTENGQRISDRLKKTVAKKKEGYQNWPGEKKRPFHSVKEEVEPISELSGTTLSNYRDKSDRSIESGKAGNRVSKRISGGLLASKKLYGDPRNVKIGAGADRKQVKEDIDFVDQLTAVVESRGMSVTFADGTKAAISPGTARRLLDRYETIGEDRQAEFIESISSNLKTLRESVLR